MGMLIKATGQDFGAVACGLVSPVTTILSGLQGIFHTTRDLTFAKTNRSPAAGVGTPVVVGTPTIGAIGTGEMVGTNANHINTKIPYSKELTLAVITKLSSSMGSPISAFKAAEYGVYADFATVLRAFTVAPDGLYCDIPNPNSGLFELIVIRQSDTGGFLKINRPSTGASATVSFTVGQAPPVQNQVVKIGGNPDISITADATVAGAAVWNRSISDGEITTFHTEMQTFFAKFGKITLP